MDCLIGAAGTYCIGVLLNFTRIVMSVLRAHISLVVKPVMNMAAKAYDMHWCGGTIAEIGADAHRIYSAAKHEVIWG